MNKIRSTKIFFHFSPLLVYILQQRKKNNLAEYTPLTFLVAHPLQACTEQQGKHTPRPQMFPHNSHDISFITSSVVIVAILF